MWLDPGESEAAEHSLAVILDVVRRYDIDGVHFDDYFYPYPTEDDDGNRLDFPDDPSWKRAQARGNTLSREDWRRENVDRFIGRVYRQIKQTKPWVKFGISPFGIWRPGHPPSVTGFDAYANLYADARKWFHDGDVDYLTPQLYWKIESTGQSYPKLLRWWHEQNQHGRHLWPGNFTSRVRNANAGNWSPEEIIRQIRRTRLQAGASGNVHFSMKALMDSSRGVSEALAAGPYREPALVPSFPWLGEKPPATPNVRLRDTTVQLRLGDGTAPWLWVVQAETDDGWETTLVPGHRHEHDVTQYGTWRRIAISTVNRIGLSSPAMVLVSREE